MPKCKCCGLEVPTKEEILRFVRERGSVDNDTMHREGYGDVGRGWDTVGKLRELADEGKLEFEITHVPSERIRHGVTIRGIEKTVITWSAKEE